MAFGLTNFTFAVVSGTFTTGQTTLNVSAGQGGRFTDFPARAVLWNQTQNANPAEAFYAGFAEIIEIGSKSGDILQTLKRGQEGTSAIASVSTDEYRVAVTMTKEQWGKVWRASPDATSPFDAIESGTADSVTNAAARLVKSNLGTDKCLLSIQGGSTLGSGQSGLALGDSTNGDIASIKFNRAASDFLALVCGTEYLRLVAGNGIVIGDPPTGVPSEILHVITGANVRIDDFLKMPASASQTIAAGVITVTGSTHKVDTEASASTDDLDIINGGTDGTYLLILAKNAARTIAVKHGTGNLLLAGGADFSLDTVSDTLFLYKLGTNWIEIARSAADLSPTWRKFNVDESAFTAASTSETIELLSLAAGNIIHAVKIKHSASFTGGGVTSFTVSIGNASVDDLYASAFDVFQAASDTTFQITSVINSENHGSAASIKITATSNVNVIGASAGSVDVWVLISAAI